MKDLNNSYFILLNMLVFLSFLSLALLSVLRIIEIASIPKLCFAHKFVSTLLLSILFAYTDPSKLISDHQHFFSHFINGEAMHIFTVCLLLRTIEKVCKRGSFYNV
jgi:hypothetical protein